MPWRPETRRTLVSIILSTAFVLSACTDDQKSAFVGQRDLGPSDSGVPDATSDDVGLDRVDVVEDVPVDPSGWEEGAWIVGYSVENRPIVLEQYGHDGPVLFLMSAIHGNERSAVTFGEQIRAVLLGGLAERAGIRVVFIGAVNPDGIAIGKRHNANDIDLNRNFPTDNFDPNGTGGTVPLSEPESQAVADAIDAADASAVISVHCCVPIIDWDGPTSSLAQVMSDAMSADARFPVGRLGSYDGSFGSYVGIELGLPIVTLEFALDTEIDVLKQLPSVELAIEAAIDWVAERGHEPTMSGGASLAQLGAALDSFVLAESYGGLPIRVDSLVQGDGQPVLLLSGLMDNDRRSLNLAEHIRRELFANVRDVPLLMVTAANPDGIESRRDDNAAGVVVADDLFTGSLVSPEAEALDALVENMDPRMVVNVERDLSDIVTYQGISAGMLDGAIPDPLLDGGAATGPLAAWTADRDISLLNLGVVNRYAQGDNNNDDYWPVGNPVIYSTLVRRLIKPDVECVADGFCDSACTVDPDCPCDCDNNSACEAAERGSDETCACDPDCAGGLEACGMDDHCDTWCPENVDPDCPCSCDYYPICEAAELGSTDVCRCDPDCQGGQEACTLDGRCDTWCPEGVDPDC